MQSSTVLTLRIKIKLISSQGVRLYPLHVAELFVAGSRHELVLLLSTVLDYILSHLAHLFWFLEYAVGVCVLTTLLTVMGQFTSQDNSGDLPLLLALVVLALPEPGLVVALYLTEDNVFCFLDVNHVFEFFFLLLKFPHLLVVLLTDNWLLGLLLQIPELRL